MGSNGNTFEHLAKTTLTELFGGPLVCHGFYHHPRQVGHGAAVDRVPNGHSGIPRQVGCWKCCRTRHRKTTLSSSRANNTCDTPTQHCIMHSNSACACMRLCKQQKVSVGPEKTDRSVVKHACKTKKMGTRRMHGVMRNCIISLENRSAPRCIA
jgi:hypothetical protein